MSEKVVIVLVVKLMTQLSFGFELTPNFVDVFLESGRAPVWGMVDVQLSSGLSSNRSGLSHLRNTSEWRQQAPKIQQNDTDHHLWFWEIPWSLEKCLIVLKSAKTNGTILNKVSRKSKCPPSNYHLFGPQRSWEEIECLEKCQQMFPQILRLPFRPPKPKYPENKQKVKLSTS